jgi:hypothetical protein
MSSLPFASWSCRAALLSALLLISPAAARAQAAAQAEAARGVKIEEKVNFLGQPNNIRLSNSSVQLILATDYGPRILLYAPVNSRPDDNVFATVPALGLKSELGEWRLRGGHRLWHAPEAIPRTYVPDNDPVQVVREGNTIKLIEPVEKPTGIQKEMWVTLDPQGSHVTVTHRLTNKGFFAVDMAVWALSVMNKDGMAIIPQEPFKSHDDDLLPARPMVLWSYTNLRDPRWNFGQKFVTLRQDTGMKDPQKMGFQNRQGWAAFHHNDILFVKRFDWERDKTHPDYGCNNEVYTNDQFLELESLGPLERVQPGQTLTHVEQWWLYPRVDLGSGEVGIAAVMQPILMETGKSAPRAN